MYLFFMHHLKCVLGLAALQIPANSVSSSIAPSFSVPKAAFSVNTQAKFPQIICSYA